MHPRRQRAHQAAAGQRRSADPRGWTLPAVLGVRAALPGAAVLVLPGDDDFQFAVDELARRGAGAPTAVLLLD